jgi:hypothetical protein
MMWSNTETAPIPAWRLSMANGSPVTDLLTTTSCRVIDVNLSVTVQGHYFAILEPWAGVASSAHGSAYTMLMRTALRA